jgi:hypothetical protein
MPKQKATDRNASKASFVVGDAAFRKLSAVVGIRLKPVMKKRATKRPLSPLRYFGVEAGVDDVRPPPFATHMK